MLTRMRPAAGAVDGCARLRCPCSRARDRLRGLAGFARAALLLRVRRPRAAAARPRRSPASDELEVGGRRVELIEVGPAHTPGDAIVWVPDARVVFSGDIVFSGVTPIMWAGPASNWIAALERIAALEPRRRRPRPRTRLRASTCSRS